MIIRLVAAVAVLAASSSAVAGPMPDLAHCQSSHTGHRLACVSVHDEQGEWPDASACVTDGVLGTALPWYGPGIGDLVCADTHEWPFLGWPGACVSTGPQHFDTVCVFNDHWIDNDGDGTDDELVHCVVWIAGQAFCFYDERNERR